MPVEHISPYAQESFTGDRGLRLSDVLKDLGYLELSCLVLQQRLENGWYETYLEVREGRQSVVCKSVQDPMRERSADMLVDKLRALAVRSR